MVSTYSPNLRIEEPAQGDYAAGWATVANTNYTLIDSAIAAITSVDITGSSNITLTSNNGAADQARAAILVVKGTPTGQLKVLVPSTITKMYSVRNKVTNSNWVVFQNAAALGAGVTCAKGETFPFFTDGVTCYKVGQPVKGTIVLWAGTTANVPAGWEHVSTYDGGVLHLGGVVGSVASVAPTVSIGVPTSGTTGSTVLTINQIPAHSHKSTNIFVENTYWSGGESGTGFDITPTLSTTDTGGGLGHDHSLIGSHTHPIGVDGGSPAGYRLIAIRKVT